MRSAAEKLSTTRRRFLTDHQMGVFGRQHALTRDEARSATIMADRIRRHRQAEEQRNNFRVDLVPIEDPVVLPREVKRSSRRQAR